MSFPFSLRVLCDPVTVYFASPYLSFQREFSFRPEANWNALTCVYPLSIVEGQYF